MELAVIAAPTFLQVDGGRAVLGLGSPRPRFSWHLPDGSAAQAAHEVEVTRAADERRVWSTGRVPGAQPVHVVYGGAPLSSRSTYGWRVRVWGEADLDPGPWSEPARFETGVLDPSWWRASWITGHRRESGDANRTLYLRGAFEVPREVVRARAYVTALGWYRFFVNGTDVTGPALVPRWTPFHAYVEYQVHDVTDLLHPGSNVLAMAVGDGRFRGVTGLRERRAVYGSRTAGLVQVEIQLADGTTQVVASDGSWHAGTGRIITSDPKLGEAVDLRVDDLDWRTAEVAPAGFSAVELLDEDRTLVSEEVPPVRQVDRLTARSVTRTRSGRQLVDLGQNVAGVVRIRLVGPPGTQVTLTHSEVVGRDGELDRDYIHTLPVGRPSYQQDEVILAGAEEWWQPWFTIHGFRYVEVDGLPADLDVADVEGIVLSTDLDRHGAFSCSDERLERLHRNVWWSLRSNLVDTPTDCPTRERSGWTGDVQVITPAASTFVDVHAYLRRYLRNVAVEQRPDGRIPTYIPWERVPDERPGLFDRLWERTWTSTGWGDASVIVPWSLHERYGDAGVLEETWAAAAAWVDQLCRRARSRSSLTRRRRGTGRPAVERHILDTGWHFGEWLRPGEGLTSVARDYVRGDLAVVATAYLEHSARLLSRIASVLDRDAEVVRYREMADRTRHAWRTAFLHDDGRIGTDRQDDYVRALAFDLLEDGERATAVDRLVALIEQADQHLGTGFLSTPMLLDVLVDGGRPDVAWAVLLQTTPPSWLGQVLQGATTTWETWEGHDRRGDARDSHNHFAFGAVAEFLVGRVAGLRPAAPGWRRIDVAPLVDGPLTSASASLMTPFGRASSSWQRRGRSVTLELTVPPGATARVRLGGNVEERAAGTHTLTAVVDEIAPIP